MADIPVEVLLGAGDAFTVSYIPSGTQLAQLREQPRPPAGRTLLALADPTFAKQPELPGSAREARAVAALFDQSEVLQRTDASAARLEALRSSDRLRDFRYLHLATHGLANKAKAFESALFLAAGDGHDGRLTARQVLETWQLRAELVTLSACESGLGQQGGGEGLLGFSQAFLLAGARSVLLSLWPVDDTATALLMVRFYQNLLGKRDGLMQPLSKAAALQEAKTWLRGLTVDQVTKEAARLPRGSEVERQPAPLTAVHPYAHPYYWSAFILIGDPE
jgi:CHAT domain-containing protein